MHPDPYENLEKKYQVGKIYDGTVTRRCRLWGICKTPRRS